MGNYAEIFHKNEKKRIFKALVVENPTNSKLERLISSTKVPIKLQVKNLELLL